MRGDWPFYISIAAVREYMREVGYSGPLEDDNPQFVAAQNELGDASLVAKRTETPGLKGTVIYRTGNLRVGPRKLVSRIELSVSFAPNKAGDKPQVVWATAKDARSTGSPARRKIAAPRPAESPKQAAPSAIPVTASLTIEQLDLIRRQTGLYAASAQSAFAAWLAKQLEAK
jgi:hypothetical protein